MVEPSTNSDRSQRIERVLVDYMRQVDAGERFDREEFLAAHAEFADELRAHFDTEDAIDDLMGVATSVDTSSTAAPLPRRFGDFVLLEEIGRGGMGVVFRSHQRSLNRIVAVKMMLAGQLATEQEVRRFQAEAKAAASLKHPLIVAIHEVGAHQGQLYFTMDYIAGESLAVIVRERTLPPKKAATYIVKVARAIHVAHKQGILHRDLKPANIVIDEHDEPHVTDFGLARRMHAESGLTVSGAIVGSPSYMPPEQIATHRGPIGPHSDVYSLGATLYELLTGRAPFVGDSLLEIVSKVLEVEPIPPRLDMRSLPRDLETICLVCLSKEAIARYSDASELAADLERWLENKPIKARRAGSITKMLKWTRRHPVLASLLPILTLLAMGFAYQGFEPSSVGAVGPPMIRVDEMTVVEGEIAHVNLRLTEPAEEPVRCKISLGNGELLGASQPGMVTQDAPLKSHDVLFNPGRQTATKAFPTYADSISEQDETLTVIVSDEINAGVYRKYTPLVLRDGPPPAVSVVPNRVIEGQSATITFRLSAPSIDLVRFKVRTLGGEFLPDAASPATVEMDVEHLETDVEFSPGESLTTITVQTLQDELREATETFVVAVTDVTFATTVQPYWPVEILDDD